MVGKRAEPIENGSATSSAGRWPGGKGSMTVAGTFGGATVTGGSPSGIYAMAVQI